MVNDKAAPVWRHQIKLIDREELTVDGVSSLGSYDEKEVVMETAQGTMVVNGEGLNVKQLNLEASNIIIEGNIKGIQYEESHKERRGILDRFLK
ncbi:YabP/YqfC family sporulation protein [Anaerosinus massiliensis]|uniref:YabP/YqfC family sporulation protein n=1 Tax=Massilibacillus massiliensis TaxID=1806837 RepID=UPI000A886B9D|nr:YabP/YqfC family sporulation protein [Massilibacillus massiliensis]